MSTVGFGRQICLSWIPSQNGEVPSNSIQADVGLYIIRARISGDLVIGKTKIGHNQGFIPYDGKEVLVSNYEVLCDTGMHRFGNEIIWQFSTNGDVPTDSVVGGHTIDNEPLYVARAKINGEMCVGKVHESHECAYMPHGGEEHPVDEYEVLCFNG